MKKHMKKLIALENRICFILNQAAVECDLIPFAYTVSQTSFGSTLYTVIAGSTMLGLHHRLFVEVYVPIDGIPPVQWDGIIQVVLDKEREVQRVPITTMIDVIQEMKDRLLPKTNEF